MKKNTFKLSIVKKDSSFEHRKSDADSKQKLDKKWLVLASLDVCSLELVEMNRENVENTPSRLVPLWKLSALRLSTWLLTIKRTALCLPHLKKLLKTLHFMGV